MCGIYFSIYIWSRKTTPAIIYAENVNSCMATLPGSDFYCRILLVSRFSLWSGAFVFTGFYLRYLNSGAVKYLWLSALCICFHYSLLALCVAAVLNLLLRYRFKVYYLILIVSFIVRFAKIAFVTNIAQFGIFENYVKESVRNQNIIQSVGKYAEEIREYGNQFYLLRETIAVFGVLAVIYILYKK